MKQQTFSDIEYSNRRKKTKLSIPAIDYSCENVPVFRRNGVLPQILVLCIWIVYQFCLQEFLATASIHCSFNHFKLTVCPFHKSVR